MATPIHAFLPDGTPSSGAKIALDKKANVTDPRFTDARTPTTHTHTQADVTGLTAALTGLTAALAGKQPTITDTGWVACTMIGAFAGQTGNLPEVRRVGGRVEFRGAVVSGGMTVSATNTVVQLPEGFAPDRSKYVAAGTNNAAAPGMIVATATGVLQVRTDAVLASYYTLDGLAYSTS